MSKKEDDTKIFAFLAVFLTIIGFIIALLAKRDNKYVMFYAKQGLVLFVLSVIISIVGRVPFIGWFEWVLWVLFVIVWIMAWLNALSGEMKNTVLIGEFAEKIKI